MHLFLIGYRGTGKTTIAPLLGQLIELPVIDLDQRIIDSTGKLIREIFEEQGEQEFRKIEQRELQQAIKQVPSVISLGGGTIVSEVNRSTINSNGKAVWLQAHPDTICSRLQSDDLSKQNRPSLTGLDLMDEIESVLAERRPFYDVCADYSVATDDLPPQEVAEQIANWWQSVDNN